MGTDTFEEVNKTLIHPKDFYPVSPNYLIVEHAPVITDACQVGYGIIHNCPVFQDRMCVHPQPLIVKYPPPYMNEKERAADLTFVSNNLIQMIRDDHHILQYQDAMQIADRLQQLAKEVTVWHEAARYKGL